MKKLLLLLLCVFVLSGCSNLLGTYQYEYTCDNNKGQGVMKSRDLQDAWLGVREIAKSLKDNCRIDYVKQVDEEESDTSLYF